MPVPEEVSSKSLTQALLRQSYVVGLFLRIQDVDAPASLLSTGGLQIRRRREVLPELLYESIFVRNPLFLCLHRRSASTILNVRSTFIMFASRRSLRPYLVPNRRSLSRSLAGTATPLPYFCSINRPDSQYILAKLRLTFLPARLRCCL